PSSTDLYSLSLHDALPIFSFLDEAQHHFIVLCLTDGVGHRRNRRPLQLLPIETGYIAGVASAPALGSELLRRLAVRRVDEVDRRSEEHTSELQSRENLVCR